MLLIGLTGSIGMGKSTTAELFAGEGVAYYDADAAVHRLYEKDQPGAKAIAEVFPQAVKGGAVDRPALAKIVLNDPEALKTLEGLIHPLLVGERKAFLEHNAEAGAFAVVLDIPLLFEKGSRDDFDYVVTVSAPADVQRRRVLARPGMTEEKFEAILAQQMPDAQKRALSDFVVDTSISVSDAHRQIKEIIATIRKTHNEA
ncbi:MAG: dephospho-CoA kinase [Parvibaculales bacterium]